MLYRDDWLPYAKRLAVGQQMRVAHKGDRTARPNLVVRNTREAWMAYCQSCHIGGKVLKEHVRYDRAPPACSTDTHTPGDCLWGEAVGLEYRLAMARFLSTKGMDFCMFPEGSLGLSTQRQRLLVRTPQGIMGRDLTDRSPQKWMEYAKMPYASWDGAASILVLTEDVFSALKVRWAVGSQADVSCVATLGTDTSPALLLKFVQYQARLKKEELVDTLALVMYDGDKAGEDGAIRVAARLHGVGIPAVSCPAPWGYDPKDLNHAEIRQHLGRYSGRTLFASPGGSPAVPSHQGLYTGWHDVPGIVGDGAVV